jgi:hypothetical protein
VGSGNTLTGSLSAPSRPSPPSASAASAAACGLASHGSLPRPSAVQEFGQDVGDPAARTARIRAELLDLLTIRGWMSPGALDPFIDYLAERFVAEIQPTTAPG